jgi:molybdate transport system substrate-binding protein
MRKTAAAARAIAFVVASILALAAAAHAAEVKVMISGGFSSAYRDLAPQFERATGNTLATERGPSMGETPQAIPNRLKRGERADVVVMDGTALDGLIKQGRVVKGSRVDLARSMIGAAVRAGAPKPDISSVEAFKRALIAAQSIAYSDSASGVYLSTELFPRLGIADQIKGKSRMIPAEPVGAFVARGEAELGFQQISELRAVLGLDIVGPLPPELQKTFIFAAGVLTGAKEPKEARALIGFLSAPAAAPLISKTGLEPVTRKPDLADLSEGTYFGDVISDSKGASRSNVTLRVTRIDRNLVRVISDYPRLPTVEVPLTRVMHAIQAARGSTTFLLDSSKSPSQLGVGFENEVSWAGAKR